MKSETNDFETLRKLMALKRYEQPPPGYFRRLPDRIGDRLERGEGQLGFWDRFIVPFTLRPALVYGFAMAALSALTFSVVYSVRTQTDQSAQRPPKNGWRNGLADDASPSQFNPSQPLHLANWMVSDNASNPAPILPSYFDSGAQQPIVPLVASPP